jgi:hypothetical protein
MRPENPTAFDAVGGAIALKAGRPDTNGRGILAAGPWGMVSPGQFRVGEVQRDLDRRSNLGLVHNVRFVKGPRRM